MDPKHPVPDTEPVPNKDPNPERPERPEPEHEKGHPGSAPVPHGPGYPNR